MIRKSCARIKASPRVAKRAVCDWWRIKPGGIKSMLNRSLPRAVKPGEPVPRACERDRWLDGEHPDRVVDSIARKMRLDAHVIAIANEKGGVGKSTMAFQIAIALANRGQRVVAIDCDPNQRSLERALLNRSASARQLRADFPTPRHCVLRQPTGAQLFQEIQRLDRDADVIVIDTAGADSPILRRAIAVADTLVTPINGSFVDIDMLAQIDPQRGTMRRKGHFAQLVCTIREARERRGMDRLDWVVVKNRVRLAEARQQDMVDATLARLAKRLDFRLLSPLRERVAFRQLALYGLTHADMKRIEDAPVRDGRAHREVQQMIAELDLPAQVSRAAGAVSRKPQPQRKLPVIERVGDAYRDMLFTHA